MSDVIAVSEAPARQAARLNTRALRVDVAADFESVAGRWGALRSEGASLAFQSEAWLRAWHEHVGSGDGIEPLPATVVDRQTGADLLSLPLIRRKAGGLTTIEFADGGLTDYNAPIMGARAHRIAPGDLIEALRGALPRADVLRLVKMPAMVGGLSNPLVVAPGARPCRLNGNIIRAPDNWDDWHRGLARTFRKELERSWRVFERRGGAFRRIVDAVEARRAFADLKRLQRARIGELGYEYTLDEARNEAFYDAIVETGIATGEVVLTTLEAEGEMVAGLLGIAKGDHYCMTRLAQAGGDWKNVSPGRLVIERTMKHLHGEGYRQFDFTIGEYAYKRRLGVEAVPLFDLELALSWRGVSRVLLARAKTAARQNPAAMAAASRVRALMKRG